MQIVRINGMTADELEAAHERYEQEHQAVAVEAWYDRSRHHWVIYQVDIDGNQMEEARYGFSKAEAQQIKRDIMNDIKEG